MPFRCKRAVSPDTSHDLHLDKVNDEELRGMLTGSFGGALYDDSEYRTVFRIFYDDLRLLKWRRNLPRQRRASFTIFESPQCSIHCSNACTASRSRPS